MALGNITTFTLDMVPGGAPPIIHVSAGDVGRKYKANLTYNGVPYEIQGNRVTIRGTKPDNTVFEYPVDDFEHNESWVDFLIEEQMAIVAGTVRCELREYSGDDQIGSANFRMEVETAVYDPNAISESEVQGLNAMIQAATPEAVDDWFETEAPTSTVFTNAVNDAVSDYIDEHGMALTKDANGIVKLGGTANGN